MADSSPQASDPTPAEIVTFLEAVRDDVHYAAEAKRQQLARGYSNDTLASMVRATKWPIARERIAAANDLPVDERQRVAEVLQRELSIGTVEQIDSLLTPAVQNLRDTFELEYPPRELAISRGVPACVLIATGPPYDRNTCQAAATLYLDARDQPSFCQPLDWDQVDVEILKRAINKRRERGEPAEGLDRELDELCKHFPDVPKPVEGWEGPIPSEPFADLTTVNNWLGDCNANVLFMRDTGGLFAPGAAFESAKQALRNAERLLDQLGEAGFPDCEIEGLPNVYAAEQAIAKLRRWLRAKIEGRKPTPKPFVTTNPHAAVAVAGGSFETSWENPDKSESPLGLVASPGVPRVATSAELEPTTHKTTTRLDCGEGKQTNANGTASESQSGFLGGGALADAMGIHPTRKEAFFRQLERRRMDLGDDSWLEVRDRRPNSPRYLYRTDSIKLRHIAAAYKSPKPA